MRLNLQRVQNNAAVIVLRHQDDHTHCHCYTPTAPVAVRHRLIGYKLIVMTYKISSIAVPAYLSRYINLRESTHAHYARLMKGLSSLTAEQSLRSVLSSALRRLCGTTSITRCDSLPMFKDILFCLAFEI